MVANANFGFKALLDISTYSYYEDSHVRELNRP